MNGESRVALEIMEFSIRYNTCGYKDELQDPFINELLAHRQIYMGNHVVRHG